MLHDILMIVIGLIVGLIIGFFVARFMMKKYMTLINEKPIDLVCLGVGENGHIAFTSVPLVSVISKFK